MLNGDFTFEGACPLNWRIDIETSASGRHTWSGKIGGSAGRRRRNRGQLRNYTSSVLDGDVIVNGTELRRCRVDIETSNSERHGDDIGDLAARRRRNWGRFRNYRRCLKRIFAKLRPSLAYSHGISRNGLSHLARPSGLSIAARGRHKAATRAFRQSDVADDSAPYWFAPSLYSCFAPVPNRPKLPEMTHGLSGSP